MQQIATVCGLWTAEFNCFLGRVDKAGLERAVYRTEDGFDRGELDISINSGSKVGMPPGCLYLDVTHGARLRSGAVSGVTDGDSMPRLSTTRGACGITASVRRSWGLAAIPQAGSIRGGWPLAVMLCDGRRADA